MKFLLLLLTTASARYISVDLFYNTGCSGQSAAAFQVNANECHPISNLGYVESFTATCNANELTSTLYSDQSCTEEYSTATRETEGAAVCLQGDDYSFLYRCSALPCFSRSSLACRRLHPDASPLDGSRQCTSRSASRSLFSPAVAEMVSLVDLAPSDMVLTVSAKGNLTWTPVFITQHVNSSREEQHIQIEHDQGTITVTPEHVVWAAGEYMPASDITEGMTVQTVSQSGVSFPRVLKTSLVTDGIINPVTEQGTILVSSGGSKLTLAATHPDWIAHHFINPSLFAMPISLFMSKVLPNCTQRVYSTVIEPLADMHTDWIESHSAISTVSKTIAFATSDIAFSSLIVLDALRSLVA